MRTTYPHSYRQVHEENNKVSLGNVQIYTTPLYTYVSTPSDINICTNMHTNCMHTYKHIYMHMHTFTYIHI